MEIVLRPIGIVLRGIPEKREGLAKNLDKESKYLITSRIQVYEEYSEGLKGLEEYSHCIILWYLHRAEDVRLTLHPWNDESLPLVGIFATRFPPRPNKLGLTVVKIVDVNPPYLDVVGLDAWTGSPVLDIKPYDYYDIVRDPKVPNWFYQRWLRWYREKKYKEIAPWLGPIEE